MRSFAQNQIATGGFSRRAWSDPRVEMLGIQLNLGRPYPKPQSLPRFLVSETQWLLRHPPGHTFQVPAELNIVQNGHTVI